MLVIGIIADIIQIAAVAIWIQKGIWLPFALGMPIVITFAILSVQMYCKNTVYICTECNVHFKPSIKELLFSNHSSKARKLKCTYCGFDGWCIKSAAD